MTEGIAPKPGLIGRRIGNYDIVELLGQGGMGEVYLGRHPMLGKEVAIKVLSGKVGQDRTLVNRFKQEAMAACRIGHPAIVDVVDFGALEDGRNYCVMERLHGESLGEYLDKHGRLDLQQTVAIILPVIEALSAAHEVGVVHRDIKPDNIFLARGRDGKLMPKVLDFGIAKLLHPSSDMPLTSTKTGSLMGTPLYMSPEQAAGAIKRIGPGSDIYSVGAMLFHMLAGRPPYLGDSYGDVLLQHMQAQPPSIRNLRPDIPQGVDDVVQAALAKKPEERFHNMRALQSALTAAAASVTAAQPGAGGRPTAPQPTAPGTAASAASDASAPMSPSFRQAVTAPSPAPSMRGHSAYDVATGPTHAAPSQDVAPAQETPVQETEESAPSRNRFLIAGAGGLLGGGLVVGLLLFFLLGKPSGESGKKSKTAAVRTEMEDPAPALAADMGSPSNPAAAPAGDPMNAARPSAGRPGDSRSASARTRSPTPAPASRKGAARLPRVSDVPRYRPVIRTARDAAYEKAYRRAMKWRPDKNWDPLVKTRGKIITRLANQQLRAALNAYRRGDCSNTIAWGMASYRKKRSTKAAYIVGVCACRLKKRSQARAAYRRVSKSQKTKLAGFCRKSGIKLPQ